jgi:uncharacterized RDD family membrane protein YckC
MRRCSLLLAFVTFSIFVIGIVQEYEGNALLGFVLSLAAGLFAAVAGSVPLLLASAIQGYWGTTPGKKMFQIRIVDVHGLRPPQATLALRMAFQMMPIWSRVVITVFTAIQVPLIGYIASAILLPLWFASVVVGLIRRDGRSLHDRVLGTRVVLDAAPQK